MFELLSTGPLAPRSLLRSLPAVFGIAAILTLGFMLLRQVVHESRAVEVVDARTRELKSYRIVTVLPRDAISAIRDPEFVEVTEAARWMNGREQVIGLERGGEVRAYPINLLSRHEIVNDVVGGEPVAITW